MAKIQDTNGEDTAFSGVEGEDPTAEGWKPKWLLEQEKASQVPVNVYAEYAAAGFSKEQSADAVFSGEVPAETPADAAETDPAADPA